ncbi:MAG: hypothetical protein V3T91_02905 [Candidatus Bipolaricaulota bacterium]
MEINTASEAISFSQKLEDEGAQFYQDLAREHTQGKEVFLSFAKENAKNVVQIRRAYYGVISDAIEACFSFGRIDTNDYSIDTRLPKDMRYSDALRAAVAIEEKTVSFYSETGEVSKFLMADVPTAFGIIVKKRDKRISRLRALLEEGE